MYNQYNNGTSSGETNYTSSSSSAGTPINNLFGNNGNPINNILGQNNSNPINNILGQNNGSPISNILGQNSGNPIGNIFGQNNSNPVNNLFGQRGGVPNNNIGSRSGYNPMNNVTGHNGGSTNYSAPNYQNRGNAQYSNAVYSQNLSQGSPKSSSSALFTLSSVLLIITGIVYFFLDFIRKALGLFDSGKHTVNSFLNADLVGTYNGASDTVESFYDVINHSVCTLTIVHIITGIIGIIFIIMFASEKRRGSTSSAKVIPFLCGVVSLVTSLVYAVSLIAAHTSLFMCLIMFAVIFITPIFFTKKALSFYKY